MLNRPLKVMDVLRISTSLTTMAGVLIVISDGFIRKRFDVFRIHYTVVCAAILSYRAWFYKSLHCLYLRSRVNTDPSSKPASLW